MSHERLSVLHESPDWVLWEGQHPTSHTRVTIKEVQPRADRVRVGARLVEEYEFIRQFFKEKEGPRYLLRPVQPDLTEARVLYEDAQGTLGQLIRQEGTLPQDVANVMAQVAEVLEFLHRQKIGHGSLNSHTVLVAPDRAIRLAPFVGYKFDPKAMPPAPDHEARYQAPELLTGTLAACNPTSDLYCLGFLALEMLAGPTFNELFGLPPGASPKPAEMIAWHASRDPKKKLPPLRGALRDSSDALVEIIESLTRKDTGSRGYKTAGELLKALKEFRMTSLRGLPHFHRRPGEPEPEEPEVPEEPEEDDSEEPAREPVLIAASKTPARPLTLTNRFGGREFAHSFPGPSSVVLGSEKRRCDLHVQGADVSERHALLAWHRDTWWVYDLRSETGTYLNGQRVRQHPLANGDQLQIGKHTFTVAVQPGGTAKGGGPAGGGVGQGTEVVTRRGRLVLGRTLHQGRQGTIYQAMWESANTRRRSSVAVRVFPPDYGDPTEIARFIRGSTLAAQVRHDNVVRLMTGGKAKSGTTRWYFLVMEYLPGGSLRDVLTTGGPLSAARVVRCGLDITAALTEAAKLNLLHRNINPSCVLFDDKGNAKLGDFALLRPEELDTLYNITRAGTVPGEQVYQAPEVVAARPATPACDVYGLAATLFEALTGRPPVTFSADLPELLRRIEEAPIPTALSLRSGIPAELSRVLARGLDKNPDKRYTTAADFATALRAVPLP